MYIQNTYLYNMGKINRKILQLTIQLIYFRMCSCIYRIIININWRKYG